MPLWVAESDESKWERAKKLARKNYPELSEDNERFWQIVTTIFKKIGGKVAGKKEVKKSGLQFYDLSEVKLINKSID